MKYASSNLSAPSLFSCASWQDAASWPTDADIATILQKISRRVMRQLRQLGYLEAGIDVAVATGSDPLGDNEPELPRTMAASVQQRIACGERAGQKVRRLGSGLGYEGDSPTLTGTRGAVADHAQSPSMSIS